MLSFFILLACQKASQQTKNNTNSSEWGIWSEHALLNYQPQYETSVHWMIELDSFVNSESKSILGFDELTEDESLRKKRAWRTLDYVISESEKRLNLMNADLNNYETAIGILDEIREIIDALGARYSETETVGVAFQPWLRNSWGQSDLKLFMDCDTTSYFYLAVAEVLNLPLVLTEGKFRDSRRGISHAIIKWSSSDQEFYWEAVPSKNYFGDIRYKSVEDRLYDIKKFIKPEDVLIERMSEDYLLKILTPFEMAQNKSNLSSQYNVVKSELLKKILDHIAAVDLSEKFIDEMQAYYEFVKALDSGVLQGRTAWMAPKENPASYILTIEARLKKEEKMSTEELNHWNKKLSELRVLLNVNTDSSSEWANHAYNAAVSSYNQAVHAFNQ